MLSYTPPLSARIILFLEFCGFITYLPFLYLFYRNRYTYPIRARLPLFVLAFALVLFIVNLNEFFLSLFEHVFPCAARYFLGVNPYIGVCIIYNYRLIHLLFANKITANILECKNEALSDWTEGWYLTHRQLLRPRRVVWGSLCIIFVYFILSAVFILLDDPRTLGQACNFSHKIPKIWLAYSLVNDALAGVITFSIAYRVRSVPRDAFWIKSEFVYTLYTSGVTVVAYVLLGFLAQPRWLQSIFVMASNHSTFCLAIVYPYILTRQERVIRKPSASDGESQTVLGRQLIEVLNHPEGFRTFLAYLESEFSAEYALFWDAVDQLKKLDPEEPSTPEQVGRIYFQYCQEGAPCQIELPLEIRATMFRFLQSLKHHEELTSAEREEVIHVFDAAQSSIYDLMANDSYLRFQRTKGYRRLQGIQASPNLVSSKSVTEFDVPEHSPSQSMIRQPTLEAKILLSGGVGLERGSVGEILLSGIGGLERGSVGERGGTQQLEAYEREFDGT